MKRFFCHCGQELFYENGTCLSCGRAVGFDPATFDMVSPETGSGLPLRMCRNRQLYDVCNWWLSEEGGTLDLCRSCRLNAIIPNLDHALNIDRWRKLEQAKRRLLYTLLDLELDFESPGQQLSFAFLEDQRTNASVAEEQVMTGHYEGRITILAAEADDLFREGQRTSMNQRYRTLLGHMRHESGHFFWDQLVRDGGRLEEFRQHFGDERIDYKEALDRFYQNPPFDHANFVSPYARAHPLEDWAESFSHTLHVVDTVDTAIERELLPASILSESTQRDDQPPSTDHRARPIDEVLLDRFSELAISLNELSRSLGLNDAYPFVLTEKVRAKMLFIGNVVSKATLAT